MQESDSTAAQMARTSDPGEKKMPEVTESYLREQLERRRSELNATISSLPANEAPAAAPLVELLHEVDSAVRRMDQGTYGICEACHESIEKDRLIADPLTTLCLDHLTAQEQRVLESDLQLASQIQRGLLPQAEVRFRDWRVHYHYKPAGIVSGDYCDVIAPASDGGKLLFLVGDVAGKGVAASLLMSHLHAMFRSLAGIGLELDKLFEMANRVFCESTTAGQYATLICGRADRDGEIEITSAGHFPALHLAADGVQQVGSTGLPLGMFCASQYTVRRLRLKPGESLLLYTDGIPEANDPSGTEFGVDRLSVSARDRHGSAPKELLAACLADVQRFSSGMRPADDQTLMVVHRAHEPVN